MRTDTGRCSGFSRDLDASAQEIADLYKRRWAIELFFRWVKQVLDQLRRAPRCSPRLPRCRRHSVDGKAELVAQQPG